jgi:hypothetical protein
MQLTVVCVLWMGDFAHERHYSPAWVYRLRDQVAAHLPLPHRFVCLSNVGVSGVDTIPLATGWPGWWAKVEMFNPALNLGERVLYLDLDVFITGDLTPIAEFPAPLALMPPSHVFGTLRPRPLPGVVRRYQASCIVFEPPHGRDLYERLTPDDAIGNFRADQDWIGFVRPSCPTMPAAWFAKAKQCRDGVPAGVRVVLAHRVNLIGRTLAEVAAA